MMQLCEPGFGLALKDTRSTPAVLYRWQKSAEKQEEGYLIVSWQPLRVSAPSPISGKVTQSWSYL